MPLTNRGKYITLQAIMQNATSVSLLSPDGDVIVSLQFDDETVVKQFTDNKLYINIDIATTDNRISGLLPFTIGGIAIKDNTDQLATDQFASPKQVSSSNSAISISWVIEVN